VGQPSHSGPRQPPRQNFATVQAFHSSPHSPVVPAKPADLVVTPQFPSLGAVSSWTFVNAVDAPSYALSCCLRVLPHCPGFISLLVSPTQYNTDFYFHISTSFPILSARLLWRAFPSQTGHLFSAPVRFILACRSLYPSRWKRGLGACYIAGVKPSCALSKTHAHTSRFLPSRPARSTPLLSLLRGKLRLKTSTCTTVENSSFFTAAHSVLALSSLRHSSPSCSAPALTSSSSASN